MHKTTENSRSESVSPWLASLVMQRRSEMLSRFVLHYRKLSHLSRSIRRQMRRKLAITTTGAALLLAMTGVPALTAQSIEPDAPRSVITVAKGEVVEKPNGKCSLIEAIRNANNTVTGQVSADCAAGNPNGPDTINLPANATFKLNAVHHTHYYNGPTGLPGISSTITINGNGSTIQRVASAPDFRIIAVPPSGNLTLNDITIRGGRLDGGYDNYFEGAGIFNQGQLSIFNSTVTDNFTGSEYGNSGGGISSRGPMTITNSVIQGNGASSAGWSSGGGIYSTSTLTIINSTVSGNFASGDFGSGGGITSTGPLTIRDSTIHDNSAWGVYDGASGGGLYSHGNSSITGSTFSNNEVEAGYCDYADANWCDSHGGGITNFGYMLIGNSTLSGNETHKHGGGLANYGEATIVNVTISNNIGGGVQANDAYRNVITRLHRSIVAGNTGNQVVLANESSQSNTASTSFNIFGQNGNSGLFGLSPSGNDIVPSVGLNAIISPLAGNGGPTKTHALPPNSPAIDASPSSHCTLAPVNSLDQRGNARNQNGLGGVTNNECDIGAFEAAAQSSIYTTFYISTAKNTKIGGWSAQPGDILRYNKNNNGWMMIYDGSERGTKKNISAFHIMDDGSLLLVFSANQAIAGLGTASPYDVVKFTPHNPNSFPLGSGTFSWFFQGKQYGLSTGAEKIDALDYVGNRLLISTTGAANVTLQNGTALKPTKEDVFAFNRSTNQWESTLVIDGSNIPELKGKNISSVWDDPSSGDYYVTIAGSFKIGGVKGNAKSIVKLTPSGNSFTPVIVDWLAPGVKFPSNLDGLDLGQ